MKKTILVILAIMTLGCTYKKIDINTKEFSVLDKLNYNDINPSNDSCEWALIECNGLSPDSIIYSSDRFDVSEFKNKISYVRGFDEQCLPTCSCRYIVKIDNKKTGYITDLDSLKFFLGKIDNISEALFLANGYKYYSDRSSIYKIESDYFLIILNKLVKTGLPIQIDRFLLKVTADGEIRILGREVAYKNEDAII